MKSYLGIKIILGQSIIFSNTYSIHIAQISLCINVLIEVYHRLYAYQYFLIIRTSILYLVFIKNVLGMKEEQN